MKIAFFVQHLIVGGVEKSLLELTKVLKKKDNEITIFMIDRKGELLDKVSEGVRTAEIPMPSSVRNSIATGGIRISFRESIEEHNFRRAFLLLTHYASNHTGFAELGVDFDKIPVLQESYDIAVNYHLHSPFLVRYVSEKVTADRKYAWIHNDFDSTGYHIEKLELYLKDIDHFFCVSKEIQKEFLQRFPAYINKTEIAYNLIDVNEIRKLGMEKPDPAFLDYNGVRILSVGRLEQQKGFDLALQACSWLKRDGYLFKWFIIGNGTLRQKLTKQAQKLNITDQVAFMGIKANPYPYFKNCDLYVQSSRHEGYATTVTEAQVFHCPVVSTAVSGAKEQVLDGINGKIVSCSAEGIYKGIREVLDHPEQYHHAQGNLKDGDGREPHAFIRYFE